MQKFKLTNKILSKYDIIKKMYAKIKVHHIKYSKISCYYSTLLLKKKKKLELPFFFKLRIIVVKIIIFHITAI